MNKIRKEKKNISLKYSNENIWDSCFTAIFSSALFYPYHFICCRFVFLLVFCWFFCCVLLSFVQTMIYFFLYQYNSVHFIYVSPFFKRKSYIPVHWKFSVESTYEANKRGKVITDVSFFIPFLRFGWWCVSPHLNLN